ncbi:hypothetical protein GGH95_006395, partial [Coemansia sp. RSA 1836]
QADTLARSRHCSRRSRGRNHVPDRARKDQAPALRIAALHSSRRARVQRGNRLRADDGSRAGDRRIVPGTDADADRQRGQGGGAVPDIRLDQGAAAALRRHADDAANDGGRAVRRRGGGSDGGGAGRDDQNAADPRPVPADTAVRR